MIMLSTTQPDAFLHYTQSIASMTTTSPRRSCPRRLGGGSTTFAQNVTKSRKASTQNFVAVHATNFFVHGHVSRCTTLKASLLRMQSKRARRGQPCPTTTCPPILTCPLQKIGPTKQFDKWILFVCTPRNERKSDPATLHTCFFVLVILVISLAQKYIKVPVGISSTLIQEQ